MCLDEPQLFWGVVIDASDGSPIKGACVEFVCYGVLVGQALTDNYGNYVMFGPSHEGHYGIITAGAEGYLALGISLDPVGPPERKDFTLERDI